MECDSCGQMLPEQAKFCFRCGATIDTLPSPVSSAAPIPIPERGLRRLMIIKMAALVIVFVPVAAIVIVSINTKRSGDKEINPQEQQKLAEQKKRDAEVAAFNNMTAAQHIEQAELALKPGVSLEVIDEALRHVDAISPSAPEAVRSKALGQKLNLARTKLVQADEKKAQQAMEENILRSARTTARQEFINGLRESIRNIGIDASVSEVNGQLVIISDAFKLKPDRDDFIRQTFGSRTRQGLCTMGFKSYAVRTGVIFGNGDEYSLGCPETKEARAARLESERSERQKYADGLQNDLRRGMPGEDIQVTQRGTELVLTGSYARYLGPESRAMWQAMFNDKERSKLCGIGFSGFRQRADPNSTGMFISFGCRTRSNE